jgi:hypothetical protein
MNYLDYLKRTDNIDKYIVLMDELGYTDEEIMGKLEVSKTTLYNAKERQRVILEALKAISMELKPSYGNPDVNTICSAFMEAFNTTSVSKYDRFAAKRLAEKHGADRIAQLIKVFANSDGSFKPSISSVSMLEKKWVNVGEYMKKQIGDQPINQ